MLPAAAAHVVIFKKKNETIYMLQAMSNVCWPIYIRLPHMLMSRHMSMQPCYAALCCLPLHGMLFAMPCHCRLQSCCFCLCKSPVPKSLFHAAEWGEMQKHMNHTGWHMPWLFLPHVIMPCLHCGAMHACQGTCCYACLPD